MFLIATFFHYTHNEYLTQIIKKKQKPTICKY